MILRSQIGGSDFQLRRFRIVRWARKRLEGVPAGEDDLGEEWW